MEAVEFIKQKDRMCDYYSGRLCAHDDYGETCPAISIDCEITTDKPERLVSIVEQWAKEHPEKPERERQKPEQEQQKPEHPEESIDLHAIIDGLEDRFEKLDDKVSYEALLFRALTKQNQAAHIHLSDRIAALEKYHVESMNEPKRTNKDVLLAAFPNALMDNNGIPHACPIRLDAHYNCDKFENCLRCRHTHWLAEIEE